MARVDANRTGLGDSSQGKESAGGPGDGRGPYEFGAPDREVVVQAMRGAFDDQEVRQMRLHNFAIVTVVAAIMLTVAVLTMCVLGYWQEDILPLCFDLTPSTSACPTGSVPSRWDHFLVAGVGSFTAMLAAAFALRRVRGSVMGAVPIALSCLKVPAGGLTATLGILLMRGEFVPGLTALDNAAQIIGWAIVFGYSQELFTYFVDKQAHTLTDAAHPSQSGDAPSS